MHGDAERPALDPGDHVEGDDAEPAHADLSEDASGFEPARRGRAEVDAPLAGLAVADDAAQSRRLGDEPINELGRPCRHARDGANMFLHCFAPWLALVHIA